MPKRAPALTSPPQATAHAAEAALSEDERRLIAGTLSDPHRLLGSHLADGGVVVRAYHPDARACAVVIDGRVLSMQRQHALFVAFVPGATLPLRYSLRFGFADGPDWSCIDPYRFAPTFGELDAHLFAEGNHRRLWEVLGARVREVDGSRGVAFAVWAPNAERVSVVGDFCRWDGRRYPMRAMGSSGVFELFIPGLAAGTLYKFEIRTRHGQLITKCDPMGRCMEVPPLTASCVVTDDYDWSDQAYLEARKKRDVYRAPLNIYEVHLGSWARMPEDNNRPLTYREIAPKLIEHVCRHGFNAIELLPITEHPFSGSWGYQVSGYYAPTSRWGTPDDLRFFVNACHHNDIAVIMDWVPAHFPKDNFALARFDGTALYEHEDPRRGEHPDWGTLIFNYGRNEVRNFLVANALYWMEQYHIDGLRVDAVASMLYLDYSRQAGEWIPNAFGGRENLDAVAFFHDLNRTVHQLHPDVLMIAEESTAWPGVTQPVHAGGLGFTYKWNMGWMHDTLEYFKLDPVHRRYHQDRLSFAMVYEHTEKFIMPLSHDEVVHGKSSLLHKMPGDTWQKFANLRLLHAYMMTRPGKKLLFMGSEFAPDCEWNAEASLDWHQSHEPLRRGLSHYLQSLGTLYQRTAALWQADHEPDGFYWIDHRDHDQSVLSYGRQGGGSHLLVVLNMTPVPRHGYRIGAPQAGAYTICLSSDDAAFGGSDCANLSINYTEPVAWHGQAQSVSLSLPPLGALLLVPTALS